jgi:hypothetical protein
MPKSKPTGRFLLCVNNEAHPASLEVRKVYKVLPDPSRRRAASSV